MNWEALGAIGEIVGAMAVLVTLLYLAIQVRHFRGQAKLSAYQNWNDALNAFADSISSSDTLSTILVRGRSSYGALSPEEQMRFDHVYHRLLTILETWYFQVVETSDPGPYREEQLRNIGEVIRRYCQYPGVIDYWRAWEGMFSAETRALFTENVVGA